MERRVSEKLAISVVQTWNVFDNTCRIVWETFWFDHNRPICNEDIHRNAFYIFVPSDLDLWPLDSRLAPRVSRVRGCVSTKYEVSASFRFWVGLNGKHGAYRHTKCGHLGDRIIRSFVVSVEWRCRRLVTTDERRNLHELVMIFPMKYYATHGLSYSIPNPAGIYKRCWRPSVACTLHGAVSQYYRKAASR